MTSGPDEDEAQNAGEGAEILCFPQSRVPGKSKNRQIKDLGLSPLAKQLAASGTAPHGHWCSRCKGIWYGRGGEVQCPVCANRHG